MQPFLKRSSPSQFLAFSAFFCLLSQSLAAASLLYSHRPRLSFPPAGGFLNFEANAKWDAHAALKGMAPAEAKEKYIAEVARQQREYA